MDNMLTKTEAKETYRKTLVKMESGEICWDDNKLELMSNQIDDAMDEQTFFNEGQFTKTEMDLLSEALIDLLQKVNKKSREFGYDDADLKINFKLEDIENLIEKIQEGS